jgi:hypothetical protein
MVLRRLVLQDVVATESPKTPMLFHVKIVLKLKARIKTKENVVLANQKSPGNQKKVMIKSKLMNLKEVMLPENQDLLVNQGNQGNTKMVRNKDLLVNDHQENQGNQGSQKKVKNQDHPANRETTKSQESLVHIENHVLPEEMVRVSADLQDNTGMVKAIPTEVEMVVTEVARVRVNQEAVEVATVVVKDVVDVDIVAVTMKTVVDSVVVITKEMALTMPIRNPDVKVKVRTEAAVVLLDKDSPSIISSKKTDFDFI